METATASEIRDSRRTVIHANLVKLLLFGALVPPVVSGLAQQAHGLGGNVDHAAAVAMTVSTGAVFAVIGAIVLGRLADVGPSSLASRWICVLGGSIVGIVGLAVLVTAGSHAALTGGWAITQLGFSGAMAVLRAQLGSALPAHRRRGAVTAVLLGYLGAALPMAILFMLPGHVWTTSIGLALLGSLATVIALRPTWAARRDRAAGEVSDAGSAERTAAAANSRTARIRILGLQLTVHALVATYLSYHALDLATRISLEPTESVRASVVVLAAALLGLVAASAMLVWRQGLLRSSYAVIAVAGALMCASLVLRAVSHSLPATAGSAVLSGAALGLVSSALLAAALEASPRGRDGRFLGLFSAAGPTGQFLGPLLGLGVLRLVSDSGDDYSALLLVMALLPLSWMLLCLRPALRLFATRAPVD